MTCDGYSDTTGWIVNGNGQKLPASAKALKYAPKIPNSIGSIPTNEATNFRRAF
jgi:hypothetical protein